MKLAQAELKSVCDAVALLFGGTVLCPPGAFNGLKGFDGAIDKITMRSRKSDFGDLKDVVRMTVVFDDRTRESGRNANDAMLAASSFIEEGKEFKDLKGYAKSLKQRFRPDKFEGDVHNCGPTKEGYRDIKFFLKMSNGMIGELQLNTKSMIKAKDKAHYIYDVIRAVKVDESGDGVISTAKVIQDAPIHMNERWFRFVGSKLTSATTELKLLQSVLSRMSSSASLSFRINKAELRAFRFISCKIYAEIGGSDMAM